MVQYVNIILVNEGIVQFVENALNIFCQLNYLFAPQDTPLFQGLKVVVERLPYIKPIYTFHYINCVSLFVTVLLGLFLVFYFLFYIQQSSYLVSKANHRMVGSLYFLPVWDNFEIKPWTV